MNYFNMLLHYTILKEILIIVGSLFFLQNFFSFLIHEIVILETTKMKNTAYCYNLLPSLINFHGVLIKENRDFRDRACCI